TGAALLLFSAPSANAFAGLPSRRFSTIALSLESGVNRAPSEAVTGCEEIRPGSRRRQISEPLLRDKRYAKLSSDAASRPPSTTATDCTAAPVRHRQSTLCCNSLSA